MQTSNINLPISVTGRHVSITEAMREHANRKVASLHLDYPRIIEAKVVLDVESGFRHKAEIVLYCADHITIEASSVTEDMYGSIDQTISKVARRMRKYKTRMLKRSHRPMKRHNGAVKLLAEAVVDPSAPNGSEEVSGLAEVEPIVIQREAPKLRPLREQEAIEEMELGDKPFVLFKNPETEKISILYRRKDGDYAVVQPEDEAIAS